MMGGSGLIFGIYNRRSGGDKLAKIFEQGTQGVGKLSTEIRWTAFDRHTVIPERAELEQQYSGVVIAGGDGTISAVLSRLVGTSLPFGIIPLGTGNDLARELGIPPLFDRSAFQDGIKQVLTLPILPVTVWEASLLDVDGGVRRHRFVNYLSCGWDAATVGNFSTRREAGHLFAGSCGVWGNRALFLLAGLSKLGYRLPMVEIREGGRSRDSGHGLRSVLFANIRSIMGLGRSNEAGECSDDRIEVRQFPSLISYLRMLLPRTLLFVAPTPARSLQTPEIVFESSERAVAVQADGEFLGDLPLVKLSLETVGQVLLRSARA